MTDVTGIDVSTRPLGESDLPEADRIMRLALGTFLGLPDPWGFLGDAAYVRTRWLADPATAFAAYVNDELVGSNFVSNWGRVGFFGPLTIRPNLWNRGIGTRLVEPIMERFAEWGIKHTRVSSPLPIAQGISTCTRSSASGRVSSPRSCPSRLRRESPQRSGRSFLSCQRASEKTASTPAAN